MESRHHTGKWKKICAPCILFLLTVLRQCDATEGHKNFNNTGSCLENEYLHGEFCCDKCPPGFKLTQKCPGPGLRSGCVKCSPESYQDNMNHFQNCFSCRTCDPASNEIELSRCTHTQDRKCGCMQGFYQEVLDDITMSCVPCRKCGTGEMEIRSCNGQMNTECECKYNHYRVAKRICAQCTNCSSKCSDLCTHGVKTTPPSHPTSGYPLQTIVVLVWVCLCLVIGLPCIVSLYKGVKHWKKRKQNQYSQSSESHDPEKQEKETHKCVQSKDVVSRLLPVQPDPVLPDCIPREIKTHEFVYLVLEIVPVTRFKELVRRLNVSEQDIGRAERDNRAFADAQYQMLMVWVDSGTRGGKSILPHSLFQECVDRLKDMNLTACAESIEDKYA
ncbi:tumor necrosis factor receptor superfamily member 1A [Ictalurus furcatus]|uniref:tumor necrosis factor receptor superfamily member 1A n=1 Tax=Ictalurus furcatus TaxID=66913 RepID=UPI002350BFDA|nr:tumor necrosis factor receptor superfamily member 1A [Ictalurus furcatus]XP_053485990.1 tumor necrosis factor receptor superfamily member 1A [Ictalurus furcatus]